jgi:hypothetical protein
MLDKPLEQIKLPDLQELITDKVQEGKTIEYKQAMYRLDHPDEKERDKQKEELLKDVSSFANTIGGHLIIGMAEDKGVPTDILGVELQNPDDENKRLHQLIETWLEPRISCAIQPVEKEAGKYVLVIRVQPSMVSPHRVVYQRQFGQFWARNSAGAYRMDTSELRRAFTLSESIYEQIKQFRRERVRQVLNGETPVPFGDKSTAILHLLPLDSFATKLSFSVSDLQSQIARLRPPTAQRSHSHRINLDGIVAHWGGGATGNVSNTAYTQLFRNGIIEAAVCDIVGTVTDWHFLRIKEIEAELPQRLPDYLGCLRALGVQPPIYCFVTLTQVKGVFIADDRCRRLGKPLTPPIDRQVLFLPEALIDDLSVEPSAILTPLFDMIWNAAGYEKSFTSDSDGRSAEDGTVE